MFVFKGGGFIHTPRTGGRCITESLVLSGFELRMIGHRHEALNIGGKVLVMVRRPEAFIKSFHAMLCKDVNRKLMSRHTEELIGCYHPSIDKFAENIIKKPGAILRYFESFILSDNDNFIGRTESLASDLVEFCRYFGVKPNIVKNSFRSKGSFPERYLDDLYKSEDEYVEKYGYIKLQ